MWSTPYEGASGEVGDGGYDRNPEAPASSRAAGDPWVHFILHRESQHKLIQFWFYDDQEGTMEIDYERLDTTYFPTPDREEALTKDRAIRLIMRVFFQETLEDAYRDQCAAFDFLEIGDAVGIQVAYPDALEL